MAAFSLVSFGSLSKGFGGSSTRRLFSNCRFAAMTANQESIDSKTTSADDVTKSNAYPFRKAKKVAVMLSFCGKDYLGMQRNPGFPTIEEELLKAFLAANTISQEWFDVPQKAWFQRASRTDKGVSAMRMVISLKMLYDENDVTKTVDEINQKLPPTVRVNEIKRVTKNFNSKNACDSRTYKYLMPTYTLANVTDMPLPLKENVDITDDEKQKHLAKEIEAFEAHEKYRITSDVLERANKLLALYIGPHYYHNFTSGKLPLEPSSQRFITKFETVKVFESNGIEMVLLEVKGQSFMLHQIRKMIGLVISIIRGYCDESTMEQSWGIQRVDIPRAPGLGLMLDQIHFDSYNQRFGNDGMHDKLEWSATEDQVDSFMFDNVYSDIIETEAKERSMLKWLQTLGIHSYEARHFENLPITEEESDSEALKKSYKRRKNEEELSKTVVDC